MIISHAEARQLTRRARHLHDAEAMVHSEILLEGCMRVLVTLMADECAAYRACSAASCRRARRCCGRQFRCAPTVTAHGIAFDPVLIVEGLYWRVLQRAKDEGAISAPPR